MENQRGEGGDAEPSTGRRQSTSQEKVPIDLRMVEEPSTVAQKTNIVAVESTTANPVMDFNVSSPANVGSLAQYKDRPMGGGEESQVAFTPMKGSGHLQLAQYTQTTPMGGKEDSQVTFTPAKGFGHVQLA